jgi:hypothetical protein
MRERQGFSKLFLHTLVRLANGHFYGLLSKTLYIILSIKKPIVRQQKVKILSVHVSVFD